VLATFDESSQPDSATGDLQMLFVVKNADGQLEWQKADGSTQPESTFGSRRDIPFACYADDDDIADRALINKRGMTVLRSGDASTLKIAFKKMGEIKGFECRDLDADGVDELFVHHSQQLATDTGNKVVRKGGAISIFSLNDGSLLKSISTKANSDGLAVLDIDGDGMQDTCTYRNLLDENARVVCNLESGRRHSFRVLSQIGQLSSGALIEEEDGRMSDGVTVLDLEGSTVSVLTPAGEVNFSTSVADLSGTPRPRKKDLFSGFARCR
jgi:hypothetical protein